MAKILNSIFGQFSGKMGGIVFARNKSGDYVRANTKGINPRTSVQIKARQMFGSVASAFRQLSSAEKTGWQEFADNYFKPRGVANVGQFSGYNAFMALRSLLQQAFQRTIAPKIYNGTTEITSQITTVPFEPMPETPIAKTFAGVVQGTGSESYVLTVKDAVLTPDGKYEINLQVGDGQGHDLAGNIDNSNYAIGYGVYVSYGNPSDNMTYSNPLAQNLGYCLPWDADAPATDLLAVQTIGLKNENAFPIGEVKRFPLLGEYALVTVYAINKYGQTSIIGSEEVQIQASL